MATTYGWFKESYDKVKDTFEYKLAKLEMAFTERILEIIELAKKRDKSEK